MATTTPFVTAASIFDGSRVKYDSWRTWIGAQYLTEDLGDDKKLPNEVKKKELIQSIVRTVSDQAYTFVKEHIAEVKENPVKFLENVMDAEFGSTKKFAECTNAFVTTRLENPAKVADYLEQMKKLYYKLKDTSQEREKLLLALYLYERMPPEIKRETNLQATDFDHWKIDNALIGAGARIADLDGRSVQMVAPGDVNRVEKPRKKVLLDVICFNCHKKGHLAKNCRSKRKQKKDFVMKLNQDRKSLLIVDMELGGSLKKCFLDGGSSVSLVRPEKLSDMDVVAYHRERNVLTAANGTRLVSDAVAKVELRVNGRTLLVELLVTTDLPPANYDVLIGYDALKKGQISVHYGTGEIMVNAITKREDDEISNLVYRYQDVLVERLDRDIGQANVPEMVIRVDPSKPPSYRRNYRMTQEEKEAMEREVEKMLRAGVIEPTGEEALKKGWNSPVLLVKKKSGEFRFCVDFRRLNDATYKLNRPLPRIMELVEGAAKANYFSKLDLASGYWQIPVAKESRPYLAFESTRNQYQFRVMPFGICNAPVTFQAMIDKVIGDIPGVSAYIDDVVIYTETLEEHVKTLEAVLDRMRKFNLKANAGKCEFGRKEIEIFGFLVANGSVKPSPRRVEAIENMKIPQSPKEIQSFLGVINYYRSFIPRFAENEAILRQQIKNWNWTTKCEEAYNNLKAELVKLPTLHPFYGKSELELFTDASQLAVAAVLMQIRDGNKLPVAYFSRMLRDAEKRYSTTEKELLAVHAAILHFRPYLGWKKFVVWTDHKPLVGIVKSSKVVFGPRWSKRLLQLAEFQFEIKHVSGSQNVVADTLSREVHAIKIAWDSVAEAQRFDSEVQSLLRKDSNVFIRNGEVVKRMPGGATRLVLPQAFRLEALKDAHSNTHLGFKKTVHRLKANYWWPGMGRDVQKFLGTCAECVKKLYKNNVVEEAQHLELGSTWETLAIDHTGPFLGKDGSKRWVIVLIDMFTKFVEAKVVTDPGANAVVEFLRSVFHRHGCPRSILSDNGKAFISEAVQKTYAEFGIKGKHSTPYNPRGNGIVERVIGTLKQRIRMAIANEREAQSKVDEAVGIYNSSVHETTGFSPFFMMHLREKMTPFASIVGGSEQISARDDVVQKSILRGQANGQAQSAVAKRQLIQDKRLNEKKLVDPDKEFIIGQFAWLVDPTATRTFQDKASERVTIVARLKPNVYLVKTEAGKELKVNIRRLLHYYPTRTKLDVEISQSKEKTNEMSSDDKLTKEKKADKANIQGMEEPQQIMIIPRSLFAQEDQRNEEATQETSTDEHVEVE